MKLIGLQLRTLLIVLLTSSFIISANSQDQKNDKVISIIGTGDIMLGSNYPSEAKLPPNDGKQLLREVKEILQDADVTFGNLEGCFLNKGGDVKKCKSACYFFRMPDRYVNYLLEAGYDVMSIANNHMGDFGAPGRENTVKVLKEAGINYAGLQNVCETSRFEIDGIKYGFCAFAPNSGTVRITDIAKAKQLVSELDKDCDIVIVSFHGGAEGSTHNRVTRKTETFYGENRGNVYEFAHAVIDAGADVVFGHGPHVARAAELYKDRFIIYSMGNFCTAGDFNIRGISGYAPIVKVYTDTDGKFLNGEIISAIQKDKTGPVIDPDKKAAKEIKRLTELDFPKANLIISDDGKIQRKELKDKEDLSLLEEIGSVFSEEHLDYLTEAAEIYTPLLKNTLIKQELIDYSKLYLGKPYRRGSKGPNYFDCSGFTSHVFESFGYKLGRTCTSQINQGKRIPKQELKPGDLIFFKGRNSKSSHAGHVGIVVDNNNGDISFIHASSKRGIIIDNLEKSTYYQHRYITGLRVI
ncbi:CapA family protein [Bacteroidales bacterium OttesenSCG-928-M11]|nr:CapA family protein [Bacteroidales bacterium OttesenSCG-928-M11]